jgi:hypothetical protein
MPLPPLLLLALSDSEDLQPGRVPAPADGGVWRVRNVLGMPSWLDSYASP